MCFERKVEGTKGFHHTETQTQKCFKRKKESQNPLGWIQKNTSSLAVRKISKNRLKHFAEVL
jgi:hypothetical protein